MTVKTVLDGEKVYLRKLKYSDAKDIYENVKHKEVVKWTLNIPHPYPKNGAIKFIRHKHSARRKKESYAFGIVPKDYGKVVGVIDLFKIDWKNKNAELGYWLGKKYWGKGLMTESVKLMLGFAFEDLNLHKVKADLFENNHGSKKVLEKSGFNLEGKIKEGRFRYGKWQNELVYGVLSKDYLAKKN
ncbi:GNAT family N-acetyltransferase [Candidatus Woesearchaeota archaeon]|nr:GNAT family N-acetyltransferase [Candidatus Woesearchaeota archaeon]